MKTRGDAALAVQSLMRAQLGRINASALTTTNSGPYKPMIVGEKATSATDWTELSNWRVLIEKSAGPLCARTCSKRARKSRSRRGYHASSSQKAITGSTGTNSPVFVRLNELFRLLVLAFGSGPLREVKQDHAEPVMRTPPRVIDLDGVFQREAGFVEFEL
jgi:hypothetical protein